MRLTELKTHFDIKSKRTFTIYGEKQVNTEIEILHKLGQLEDIEDNLPAFNGLQHLFAVIDLMEQDEELHFTYKGKTFAIERNE